MGVYQAADLHQRSKQYAGDSHDVHAFVGLYWEIADVHAHSTEVGFERNFGGLLADLRNQVIEHAKSWVSRHAA